MYYGLSDIGIGKTNRCDYLAHIIKKFINKQNLREVKEWIS